MDIERVQFFMPRNTAMFRKSLFLCVLPFVLAACLDTPSRDKGGDDTAAVDADGDGVTVAAGDCDDADATVNPLATEVCDEVDNNCDGEIDEGVGTEWFADADGDGFGDAEAAVVACEAPSAHVEDATDCDDAVAEVSPAADEVCDEVDNNCDGEIDEDTALDALTFYADTDADGFGDADSSVPACVVPSGFSADDTDCDDNDGSVYPVAPELCDGLVNDCEGALGAEETDADSDGYVACEVDAGGWDGAAVTGGGDCDDSAASVNPGATEYCNGVDDDCDSTVDGTDMVSIQDASGAWSNDASYAAGTSASPASVTLSTAGDTVYFCEGHYYANTVISADVDLVGLGSFPGAVVLDGAGVASVLNVGQGVAVSATDLKITGGYGSPGLVNQLASDTAFGGGILCESEDAANRSSLTLAGVNITGNVAGIASTIYGYGGGIFAWNCDASITDSEISGNEASFWAGGLFPYDSTFDLVSSTVEANSALLVGAAYVLGEDFSAEMTLTNSVVHGNFSSELDGAAVAIEDGTLTSTATQWGDSGSSNDNAPGDIYTGAGVWNYEDSAGDFVCDELGCPMDTVTWGTSHTSGGSVSTDRIRGNVVQATSNDTISNFEMYLDVDSSCSYLDFYVLENTSSDVTDHSSWTIAYASREYFTPSSSWDYYNSDTVDYQMTSGAYYAFLAGWNCSVAYYYTGSLALSSVGFGTLAGYMTDNSYPGSGTFDVSDLDIWTSTSTTNYDTTVNYHP